MAPNRTQMLNALRAHDFAVYEAALYLDGHPDDKDALEYWKDQAQKARKLRRDYEECFGPLTIYNGPNEDRWTYIGSPWPWEREAN